MAAATELIQGELSHADSRSHIVVCLNSPTIPRCLYALARAQRLGHLTQPEIRCTVTRILGDPDSLGKWGEWCALEMLAHIDRASAVQLITKTCPEDKRGALYTWERIDALASTLKRTPDLQDLDDITPYVSDAWSYYATKNFLPPAGTQALAALVPLTTSYGAAATVCPEGVLRLMSLEELPFWDGCKVLGHVLTSCEDAAPIKTVGFFDDLMFCIGKLSAGTSSAPAEVIRFLGELVALRPEYAGCHIVRVNAWAVVEQRVELPPKCLNAMAGKLAERVWKVPPAAEHRILGVAKYVLRNSPQGPNTGSLYTALFCAGPAPFVNTFDPSFSSLWGPFDYWLIHATKSKEKLRPEQLRRAEKELLGCGQRSRMKKVAKGLGWHHGKGVGDLELYSAIMVVYERARVWKRRKVLLMCAALAAKNTKKACKRGKQPAANNWVEMFGSQDGSGKVTDDLFKIVMSYM